MMIVSAVLPGDDVLDVKTKRLVVLVDTAVLTSRLSSRPDQSSRRGIHQTFLPRSDRALACRMAIMVPAATNRSYSARSREVKSPSLHFRANSSTRFWIFVSTLRRISFRAASTFKLRLTGSSMRSKTADSRGRLSMGQLYMTSSVDRMVSDVFGHGPFIGRSRRRWNPTDRRPASYLHPDGSQLLHHRHGSCYQPALAPASKFSGVRAQLFIPLRIYTEASSPSFDSRHVAKDQFMRRDEPCSVQFWLWRRF